MLYRLAWFTLVSCAIAWGVFFVAGKLVFAQAAGENDAVEIRDVLGPGSHHLSGMVQVPQTCDQLQEHIEQVSGTLYQIDFQTWQDPSVTCDTEETPRAFHDVLFAPATGIEFVATLNGASLFIDVIPVVEKPGS